MAATFAGMILDSNTGLELSNQLFWDTNPASLDAEKHRVYITERVLTRGSTRDFGALLRFYGKARLSEIIKNIQWLDEITMHFCAVYFEISLEDMTCYKRRQSSPERYPF